MKRLILCVGICSAGFSYAADGGPSSDLPDKPASITVRQSTPVADKRKSPVSSASTVSPVVPSTDQDSDKKTNHRKKELDLHSAWAFGFMYGNILPYVSATQKPTVRSNTLGFDITFYSPLCRYFGFFSMITSQFYGHYLSGNDFSSVSNNGQPVTGQFFWDLSYTIGARTYVAPRIFFLDAGVQVSMLMVANSAHNLNVKGFGLQGMIGGGFNYDLTPHVAVQIASHFTFPITSSLKLTTYAYGWLFDIALSFTV